jgi:hypothetical protein
MGFAIARNRLIGPRDPVCWMFHEFGEIVNTVALSQTTALLFYQVLSRKFRFIACIPARNARKCALTYENQSLASGRCVVCGLEFGRKLR